MEDEEGQKCPLMESMGVYDGWNVSSMHNIAMSIMEGDWDRMKERRKENRRMNEELELVKGKLRVSELELRGEKQRGKKLEDELEGLKKKTEEIKRNKEVRERE